MSIHKTGDRKKVTISTVKAMKSVEPIAMITAYDALFARIFDESADIILVGDSLNMSFAGRDDTLSADMDMMIYHTKAVCMGAKSALVVLDMPFGSYVDEETALRNAVKVYRRTDAQAVKIEGGKERAHIIKTLCENSIAVMGHIGLMPQFVRSEGGYKIKGKGAENIDSLVKDAKAIEEAGAFAIVVEGVKSEAAKVITEAVNIPTIGIGAGVHTDGQVLVWSDMFGFFEEFRPKFVKEYMSGAGLIRESLQRYVKEVKNREFPDSEHMY